MLCLQLRCNYIALSYLRSVMSKITNEIITEIAKQLNSWVTPPVKNGIPYKIVTFKGHQPEKWVLALISTRLSSVR